MKKLIILILILSFNSGCAKLLTLVDESLKKPIQNTQQIQPTQNTQVEQPKLEQPKQQPAQNNNSYNNVNNSYNNTTNNYYYNQQPQVVIVEPKTYRTPVLYVRQQYDSNYIGIDEFVSWSDTGAINYTLYRTYSQPEWINGWQRVATLTGTSMIFEDGGRTGIHYYKVVANYADGIMKTSAPVQ